jgi:plasmid replication initiation protein
MDGNALVVKSNALVEASYRLGLNEQRLILACISQIRRDEPITDKVMYSISASEFAKICDIDSNTAYRELKTTALTLKRREVRITQEPNGLGSIQEHPLKKNRFKNTLITGWVQSIKYSEGDGTVQLRFNHDILPYLTELSKCFTSYKLGNVVRMSSSYGVRIYELLIQWGGFGEREISISRLKENLQIEKKYEKLKDLKRRVLEPAIKDINKNSNLWVKYEKVRTGRVTTHLIFEFGEKEEISSKTQINEPKIFGVERSIIEKKAKTGETYKEAAMRIKKEKHKD